MREEILIIAGEESGDMHGSALVYELKKMDLQLKFFGIGGEKMKSAGVELIYKIEQMAFLGFIEVLKHLPFINKVKREIISLVKKKNVKIALLIDYPGFNLNIAKKLRELDVKIIYYISPQIWAWGKGRLKKIKKLVHKMIVLFPFEEKIYRDAGVDSVFAGHPLLNRINEYKFLTKNELYEKFNLDKKKEMLLILPGSRINEVKKIFPSVINGAKLIANKFNLQIVVSCAPNIDTNILCRMSNKKNFTVVKNFTYDLLKYSKFGIIKSGTSALEAAILELPMIVVYKTNFLTYLLGKALIKVNNIALINIVAGKEIVPELIQNQLNQSKIYTAASKILSDQFLYMSMKAKLREISKKLGETQKKDEAAKIIFALLNE